MPYTYSLPTSASFTGKGLLGYTFGPLNQKDFEIYYIEVETGHDTFMISRKITRIYYVLSGSGYFTIDTRKYHVGPGILVEIPPKVEYSYSGTMTLLAISKPRWFRGNDTFTRWNPDVVRRHSDYAVDAESWSTRLLRLTVFRKSPIRAFLRMNQRLWNILPSSFTDLSPILSYATFLHTLACIQDVRGQAFSTFFLRNRPQLELIRRLLHGKSEGGILKVAVLGCSIGAEAYAVAWTIRSARPDLTLVLHAMDVSKQAVEFAARGVYSLTNTKLTSTSIFERMTAVELEEVFDRDGDVMTVKSCIAEGINWHVGDVGEPDILDTLGPQDMVIANNFLCHMVPPAAERCLRNIVRLVSPRGYLLVSGIDLDIRTKVASELGWNPLQDLIEEIHEGDPSLRSSWPFNYAGLEPLNKRRRDWRIRYATVFQLG